MELKVSPLLELDMMNQYLAVLGRVHDLPLMFPMNLLWEHHSTPLFLMSMCAWELRGSRAMGKIIYNNKEHVSNLSIW